MSQRPFLPPPSFPSPVSFNVSQLGPLGRIYALFLIPELIPVVIAASLIQRQQVAQALVGPKLTWTFEAALFLPTG